jgi:ATP-dependent Clp protease ATP-binding subunit ClpC
MSDSYAGAFAEGRNLTAESAHFVDPLFRDELVFEVLQILARRRSVLLVGSSGVGKTRVVHAVASRMRESGRAKVYEFSVSQLLSGTKYLGEWESKATRIIEAAVAENAILYFSDLWNLPTAAKSSSRDVTAWDLVRPYVEQQRLQLIGEVSSEQLLTLVRVPGFSTLFEPVTVPPLETVQIREIVKAECKRLRLDASDSTLAGVLELCQQFLPVSEGPGAALELLAQIRDYQAQKRDVDEPEDLSPTFVEKVFSIYSGLPLIVVSPAVTKPVAEVSAWFEERIIGQRDAVRAVVEMIALYKAGLHDPTRPIGSCLFVGPTGVGKTELARALARFLFGTENRLLRFDLSEYKDYHAFQLLVGDPNKPDQPARLIDPVRARPFQLVLLDEIEKAHPNVWDLLLQVLDDGRLTPALGKTVSFRNTIIIATSNVGAKERSKSSVGFVADSAGASDRMRQALEASFRPELLNRFQHIVAFHPLSEANVRQIAKMELAHVVNRQGIAARKIAVDVTPAVLDLIVRDGYDEHYGARALRRMVQRHVSVPIATILLERSVEDGSILRLVADNDSVRVDVIETSESRSAKAEARPVKTKFGPLASREDIRTVLEALQRSRLALVENVAIASPKVDDAASYAANAWENTEALIRFARQREMLMSTERRLTRLVQDERELEQWLVRAVTREERQRLADAIARYDRELTTAHRELVLMPRGSFADAVVELVELGPRNVHAIELFGVYDGWAKRRGYSVEMVHEPLSPAEPIVAAFNGNYAFGYLHLETGHHRFRDARDNSVVRVRVRRWIDRSERVRLVGQMALKKTGLLGGRVRSRVQVAGLDLVIQNERTLTENGSFAAGIVPSYRESAPAADAEVRRYDRDPRLIKDHLTRTTGHSYALSPDRFHEMLCRRIGATYDKESRESDGSPVR